jgi:hypothetical protein
MNKNTKNVSAASSGRRRKPNKNNKSFESRLIGRLHTNSCEFAQVVRGFFNDQNTGGVGGQSYAVFLQYPSYYRNAAGSIAQTGIVTGLLAQEQKVFDEYKVVSLKVRYLQYFTGQDRVANVAVASATGPPVSPLVVMATDADDSALWTSVSKAMGSQNSAVYNKYKGSGFCDIVMKQTDAVEKSKWLNLGAIIPNSTSPPDPNNPAKLSSVKLWVDAYQLASQVEAGIFCEWTCLFKGSYTLA